jgi:NAD(P)-dependent dehydrogenase (short-subunit alcohol dehydrogenase family)
MEIAGKVAVVTGGGSGIGRAVCRRFGAAGARVAVADINEAPAREVAREIGGLAIRCDVASEDDVLCLARETERALGPIDLFFSNAGIATGGDPITASNEVWERQWAVNFMAHVYATRAVLPGMLERGGGYLLHTSSMAGILSSHGNAVYAATKHAVVGLAEWLAFTYAHRGIKVSCLCPLGVRTPMLGDPTGPWAQAAAGTIKEPEEVAELVLDAVRAERFLILTDPIAQQWMERKTADPDRWLRGMNRLQRRIEEAGPTGPVRG